MKYIAFCLLLLVSVFSLMGQNLKPWKIKLEPGQNMKIINSTSNSISQQMMGQDMQMNMATELTDSFFVKAKTENGFQVGKITKRIKMNMDIMGQQKEMDSDKKEDMESEGSSAIKDRIGVLSEAVVSSAGQIKMISKAEENVNTPMGSFLSLNGDSAVIAGCFLNSPQKTLKPGENWSEIMGDSTNKEETVYSFIKIESGHALLSFETKKTITGTQEMNTVEVKSNMLITSKGTLKVELATGLVIERLTDNVFSGSNEAMGMEIPLTGTGTSKIIITKL
jgi:hypothetical protein